MLLEPHSLYILHPVTISYSWSCSWSLSEFLLTHTQPFYGTLDFVRDNPGEPVPEETFTHSHSSWSSNIPICFLHLLWSMASSLFNPHALQSFSAISLQVFFGLPLGLAPSGFNRARDSEWQWHQLGHMQICTLTHTHNHASIPPLSFLQTECPSCHPTNSIM